MGRARAEGCRAARSLTTQFFVGAVALANRELLELRALGITTNWAASYLLLDGRRAPAQLRLW